MQQRSFKLSRHMVPWQWFVGVGVMALLLVGCGGSSNNGVSQTKYAYLYSQIDYPLQMQVNGSDSVTLTLSPNNGLVTTAPNPGQGATSGTEILLHTDLQHYQSVYATVQATDATTPILWQLTSAPEQQLLVPATATVPARYVSEVQFRWNVQAVAAGQNTAHILLTIDYVLANNGQRDPTTYGLTAAPVPILAIQPNALNTTLPPFKLPFISLTSLAGLIGLFRFIQGLFQNVGDAVGAVKGTVNIAKGTVQVAGQMRNRLQPQAQTQNAPTPDQLPPTVKREERL